MKKITPSYFETKRKIEHLKNLVEKKLYPEDQYKLLSSILKGTAFKAITLANEQIYRARWNEKGCLFDKAQQLIYPKEKYAKKGRFNDVNKSVFYGAICELGTIIELRPEFNRFFTISRFKLTSKKLPFFFPIGLIDKFPINYPIKNTQKLVIDFLNYEITKKVESKDEYDVSILIGKHYLSSRLMIEKEKFLYAGIAYPSVESKIISNKTTYNLVMMPNFFHEYYVIEESTIYVLTNEFSHYQLNPINKGTLSQDGRILWTYDFEKMKARVSQGLLYDGTYHKSIIGMENLL